MRSTETVAMGWLSWFNSARLVAPERFYARDVEFQRLGLQQRVIGRDSVAEVLREEVERRRGRQLKCIEILRDGDAIAIEAECQGFDPESQQFDSPYVRLGPMLIFLTIREGLITQDHSYVAAAPQRIAAIGLDEVTWESSRKPMPELLQLWEQRYNSDPVAMMMDCYSADGTVMAMRIGAKPVARDAQIATEQRSAAAFPGRRIEVKRWLAAADAIGVELTWEGRHHRDPNRSLRTISACYLRLRDGCIAIDHTYVPTGLA